MHVFVNGQLSGELSIRVLTGSFIIFLGFKNDHLEKFGLIRFCIRYKGESKIQVHWEGQSPYRHKQNRSAKRGSWIACEFFCN